MSPQTRTFLDENRLYVSWGILIGVAITAIMVGKTIAQLDELTPMVAEFQNLKLEFVSLRSDVNNLKEQDISLKSDVNNIRVQLHLYNVDTKQP